MLRRARLQKAKEDVKSILHLPLVDRVLHSKARRPITVVTIGVGLMVTGSMIASHKDYIGDLLRLSHVLVDTFGYFVHGVGMVPALRYIEPFWLVLFGATEGMAADAVEGATVVSEMARQIGE